MSQQTEMHKAQLQVLIGFDTNKTDTNANEPKRACKCETSTDNPP